MGNQIGTHHLSDPLFTVARDQSATLSRLNEKAHARTFAWVGVGSMRACIFAFTAVLLGVNPFFMPRIVARLGLVLGFVAICVSCAAMLFLMKILAKVRDEVCRNTYGGVVEKEYGKVQFTQLAQYLTEMLILVYSLVQMTFHQFCLSKLAGSFLSPFFGSNWLLCESAIILLNLLVVLPCSLYVHRLTEMKSVLSIPIVSSLLLVFLLLFRSPDYIEDPAYQREGFKVTNLSIVSWEALAELLLTFDCSRFLFIICYEMTGYTYRRITKILNRSYALTLVIYLIVGCLGYVAFLGKSPDWMQVDETLLPISDWGTGILRVCYTVSLLLLMPLNVIPARVSLLHLVSGITSHHNVQAFNLATVAIVICSVVMGVFWYETLYYFSSFALVVFLACCLPSKS